MGRIFSLFLFFIILTIGGMPHVVLSEVSQTEVKTAEAGPLFDSAKPHIKLAPVPMRKFAEGMNSIIEGSAFLLSPTVRLKWKSLPEWRDWESNEVSTHTEIPEVNILFENEQGKTFNFQMHWGTTDQLKQMAEGKVAKDILRHRHFTIKHNRMAYGNGVYEIWSTKRQTSKAYLPGLDKESLLILISKPYSDMSEAIYLCPRDALGEDEGNRITDSGYRIKKISYAAEAKVYGMVNSGIGTGAARSMIQTSKNVAPAMDALDQSAGDKVYTSLAYQPLPGWSTTEVTSEEDDSIFTGGVRASVELVNSFGNSGKVLEESVITVRKIHFTGMRQMWVLGKKRIVDKGVCYGIIRERRVGVVFKKKRSPVEGDSEPVG